MIKEIKADCYLCEVNDLCPAFEIYTDEQKQNSTRAVKLKYKTRRNEMLKTYIEGETMIFRKDFNDRATYSTTLSKKNKDGEWENGFIPVQFRKDVFLHNKTKINIKNAWLTFYKDKENKTVLYIFVNEFEEIKPKADNIPEGFATLDDDDEIPF